MNNSRNMEISKEKQDFIDLHFNGVDEPCKEILAL
jgi:hypothetical protein